MLPLKRRRMRKKRMRTTNTSRRWLIPPQPPKRETSTRSPMRSLRRTRRKSRHRLHLEVRCPPRLHQSIVVISLCLKLKARWVSVCTLPDCNFSVCDA
ncbi:hypothetical protein P691DRAFT_368574 [Macrolepiota fuliginosa MF-IS2]|uniref:Uncharacterized protein n=1 Tax=Macrolepiota fuliginosa MF-IS2 TaxID=1400762 RepID=A0A9P5X5K2_9AGAR|nr:hypothetical protein P691DRAFT_368574 [Macrolepiota fuliginosa MF-IS2]